MAVNGDRIRLSAESVGVELGEDVVSASARFLDRIERGLTRKWTSEDAAQPASRPDDTGVFAGPLTAPTPVAPALAGDGGAYISLLSGGTDALVRQEGALTGWTFAVKDLIAVREVPLGAGSQVRAHAKPEHEDAAVVASLRIAGASVVGTTALHEFAFGVTGVNQHTGTPVNPASPHRMPGGSSSGSAVAVAEGSARAALGTDTGGSVRIPAALCGVVGFKPSHDRYPTVGVFPLSPSLDHVGLLASNVVDVATVHTVLSGESTSSKKIERVGVMAGDLAASAPRVRRAVERVLELLRTTGIELVDLLLPPAEWVFAVSTAIMFHEAAEVHRPTLDTMAEAYGTDVRLRLIQGRAIPAEWCAAARLQQADLRLQVEKAIGSVDCVMGPTVPVEAPQLGDATDPAVSAALVSFTRVANVTGIPAISVPIPTDGASVGLQVIGLRDDIVLAAAHQLEAVAGSRGEGYRD